MEETYSTPYLIIPRADLHNILLQEAKRLEIIINLGVCFASINLSEPSVAASDGIRYVADTIIGADGERSVCRDALYDCNPSAGDSGDHVFRVTIVASDIIILKISLIWCNHRASVFVWTRFVLHGLSAKER